MRIVKVLKDYYFPVRLAGVTDKVYATFLDPTGNGIPWDASVIRISAQSTKEYMALVCLHSSCGWIEVQPEASSQAKRQRLDENARVHKPDITFQMMLRVNYPPGSQYNAFHRPNFDLTFQKYDLRDDGTLELAAEYVIRVEAVTKIAKTALPVRFEPVKLTKDKEGPAPTESPEASVLDTLLPEIREEAPGRDLMALVQPLPDEILESLEFFEEDDGSDSLQDETFTPVPGTFTQDWGADIFSESHNDDQVQRQTGPDWKGLVA